MTIGPWLTVSQAAERSQRGIRTIHRALADETLRGYQAQKRGRWRIHIDDLDAWVRGEVAEVRVQSVTSRRAS